MTKVLGRITKGEECMIEAPTGDWGHDTEVMAIMLDTFCNFVNTREWLVGATCSSYSLRLFNTALP